MKRFPVVLLAALLNLTSCTQEPTTDNPSKKYFDLKGFFQNEAETLQEKNLKVEKTVAKNDLKESKSVMIRNWTNELDLFAASDINKPAWADLYQTKVTENRTQYLAKETSLRTKRIIIDRSGEGKITHIFILNDLSNNIYSSTEKLDYYPDSLYRIEKQQKILIIGNNNFSVTGRLLQ